MQATETKTTERMTEVTRPIEIQRGGQSLRDVHEPYFRRWPAFRLYASSITSASGLGFFMLNVYRNESSEPEVRV